MSRGLESFTGHHLSSPLETQTQSMQITLQVTNPFQGSTRRRLPVELCKPYVFTQHKPPNFTTQRATGKHHLTFPAPRTDRLLPPDIPGQQLPRSLRLSRLTSSDGIVAAHLGQKPRGSSQRQAALCVPANGWQGGRPHRVQDHVAQRGLGLHHADVTHFITMIRLDYNND